MNKYYPGAQPQQQSPWLPAKRRLDYLFIMLLAAAIVCALLALALVTVGLIPGLLKFLPTPDLPLVGGPSPDIVWFAVGAALLSAIVFFLLARIRIKRSPAYQFLNGCPSCKQLDLIRVHRSKTQRVLGAILRIPLRSYACRNCAWNGALLFYVPPDRVGEAFVTAALGVPMADGLAETVVDPEDILAAVELEKEVANDDKSKPPVAIDRGEVGAAAEDIRNQAAEHSEEPEQIASKDVEEEADHQSEGVVLERSQVLEIEDSRDRSFEPPSATVAEAAGSLEFQEEDIAEDVAAEETALPFTAESDQADAKSAGDVAREGGGTSKPDHQRSHVGRRFTADPAWATGLSSGESSLPGRAVVIAPFGLSMRSAPDKQADIVMSLEADTVVEILDRNETGSPVSWHRVRHEDQVGWVSAAFLRYLHS